MALLLITVFTAVVAIDVWAGIVVVFKCRNKVRLQSSYYATVFLTFLAAMLATLFISYYDNPNTRVFGWPIPRVVFQRETPTSPWLDYIGPTIVLAYPMNFVLYLLIPSVVFLILAHRCGRRSNDKKA